LRYFPSSPNSFRAFIMNFFCSFLPCFYQVEDMTFVPYSIFVLYYSFICLCWIIFAFLCKPTWL
jgi:hypothetical protein